MNTNGLKESPGRCCEGIVHGNIRIYGISDGILNWQSLMEQGSWFPTDDDDGYLFVYNSPFFVLFNSSSTLFLLLQSHLMKRVYMRIN